MVSTETFKLFWVVSLSSELFPWFYDSCFSLRKLFRILFRSSHRKCSIKEGVLKNFAKFKRNTCARVSFLIKLQAWGLRLATLSKKRPWHSCFPVNFAKFSRTPFYRTPLDDCFCRFFVCLFDHIGTQVGWSSNNIFET